MQLSITINFNVFQNSLARQNKSKEFVWESNKAHMNLLLSTKLLKIHEWKIAT